MKYLSNLKYILLHKWYVFIECYKHDQWLLGLLHDWSKFGLSEFIPYANFFYSGISRRDEAGYYKPTDTGDLAFDYAWLLHQKRNKHHWQWWILPKDEEGVKILPMPERYIVEMIADWESAAKVQKSLGVLAWYNKHGHRMQLHPRTRKLIERRIGFIAEQKDE